MNDSGSTSSTSANQQSTVVVRAAATTASTAQPRTATEAAVESVASTFSAVVEGAPETQADANAFSDALAPPNLVSDVVSKVLASVGLSGRATARDFGQGGPASAAEGTLTAGCRTVDAVGCGRPARRPHTPAR